MTWLAQLIAAVAAWLAQKVTKQTALFLAAVAVFVQLTTAMAIAIKLLLNNIVMSISDSQVLLGMSWLIPDNLSACIAAYAAALMIRWAYNIALFKLNYWNSLTGGYN